MVFLIPLILGFTFNLASAFTSAYSRRWGQKYGSMITIILRNVLGIPVWAYGLAWAAYIKSPALFTVTPWTQTLGWMLIILGASIVIIALRTLRLRAAAPAMDDKLAQNGIYSHVRNPIHTGTIFEFFGIIMIIPTQAVALACIIGIGWVLLQTRLDEYDLLQRMPGYGEYIKRVPRYFPVIHLPGSLHKP